ncbi:methyltransferase [Actinomadura sp. 7K507]|uniref:methyltransferase n=1 Tax=Actinomadura sp. 7K507 TaxID=2530365 RepID=UPI0010505AD3|nr:methyltransferase [Actinomadura sp. 7K507]TDC85020.1 methyltransferase domain-containing protein [Actinomadura sp. 7K507]
MAEANPDYTPTVSAEQVERIRRWHEDAYARRAGESPAVHTFDYLGLTLTVPPDVQPIAPVSSLLGEAVLAEVREGDRVLDMGTGSGVNAILAASKARRVVAVDTNPVALEAARGNAEANGVAERVEVRHSDVFSNVSGEFDLIIFDPPFRWFAPRDLRETATADQDYRAMTTFFHQARRYLRLTGRMLIFFGTSGDLGHLRRLADEQRFKTAVVAHDDLVKEGWRVDYYTFRMTP